MAQTTYYEPQPLIEYGFTDFMGDTWCNEWVDTYNQFTKDINKSADKPVIYDGETWKEREFFLNQRHKTFVQYMEILNENKGGTNV